ncbi:hypothetical protein H5410_001585 [Solanum commersonii]|uniref:DUF7745 domain-containing protein n=1 Tax=Solanum commersonii TaxID=4109 RepID=A0A9J6AZK7_SOLCO|nr:hypothetical protein H5410_001585 [Solanum commersonii]
MTFRVITVSVPHILQNWWQNIQRIHEAEIRGDLGTLLSLLGTQCDKVFVTHLMGFWKPSTIIFKFLDFEITPTLEEFNSLTELPIRGRLPMIPSAICTGDFLNLLDLHIIRSLRYVDSGYVKLDYPFQRFGHLEGYYEYHREFECTRKAWEHMRSRVFVMAFLGVMVFSIRKGKVAHISEQPYWRCHPMKVFMDKRSDVCEDPIFFLYRVNWAEGNSNICTSSGYATIWSHPRHSSMVNQRGYMKMLSLQSRWNGKKSASRVGIHNRFGNRKGKMVHTGVLCLAEYCDSYGSSKRTRAPRVCRQLTD